MPTAGRGPGPTAIRSGAARVRRLPGLRLAAAVAAGSARARRLPVLRMPATARLLTKTGGRTIIRLGPGGLVGGTLMTRSWGRLACAAAGAAGLLSGLGTAAPAPRAARAAHAPPAAHAVLERHTAPAGRAARAAHTAQSAPAPFVIIMMENHGLRPILNNRTDMPYLNSLWRGGGSLDFPHYAALAHPSLPDYLGMASGFTQATSDSVHPGQYAGPAIWDQLTQAGVSWGIFEEGMPKLCSPRISYNDPATSGQYLLRHNPGIPFGTVYNSAECQQVQPLSALNYASLPAVSFITPNSCDDMHGLTAAQLSAPGSPTASRAPTRWNSVPTSGCPSSCRTSRQPGRRCSSRSTNAARPPSAPNTRSRPAPR